MRYVKYFHFVLLVGLFGLLVWIVSVSICVEIGHLMLLLMASGCSCIHMLRNCFQQYENKGFDSHC